jgi:hypothetical protein
MSYVGTTGPSPCPSRPQVPDLKGKKNNSHQLELDLKPALRARFALLGEPRRVVPLGFERLVPPPPPPPPRHKQQLPIHGEEGVKNKTVVVEVVEL